MRPSEHASMMRIIERMGDMPDNKNPLILSVIESDGTCIITVKGFLMRGLGSDELIPGIGCMDSMRGAIEVACENDEVKRVILDIDSVGGTYNGIPELSDIILRCREKKPMAAFTAGDMSSGAYWLGISTGLVFWSPSAKGGSIGAVKFWDDRSKHNESRGITTYVFSSGEYKGINEDTPLTESQIEYMRKPVEKMANEFYSHVTAMRPGVNEAAFDGRVFMAEEAMGLGLIDGTARNIDEVIEKMIMDETEKQRLAAVEDAVSTNTATLARIEERLGSLSPQPAAQEPEKAPDKDPALVAIEALSAELKDVKTQLSSFKDEAKTSAAKAVSEAIASSGQPAPIEDKKQENLSAEDRTNAAFLEMARKMKGGE